MDAVEETTLAPLTPKQTERILVLGTAVGELVYAFERGDSVVARDISCEFPEAIQSKPAVGYFRQIGAEGILSMRPSVILTTEAAGPPNTISLLKSSGIPIHKFSASPELDALRANIRKMGQLLDAPERSAELIDNLNAALDSIPVMQREPVEVLFLLSPPGSDRLLAAGSDTAADTMIRLAGGTNAFADMRGYQPVSAELIIQRRPGIILLPGDADVSASPSSSGHASIDQLVSRQGSRIIYIDLAEKLAFGIRTGEAAASLHRAFYE
jgi:iron complex transport system substrate-binding protein